MSASGQLATKTGIPKTYWDDLIVGNQSYWKKQMDCVINHMEQARMYYLVRLKRGMGSLLRLNERLSTIIDENTYIGSFLEEQEGGKRRPMTLQDLHRRIVM